MAEVQERVAKLEGRVEGHARMLTDVVGAVRHLEARMEQRFTIVDGRLTALDQKLDQKTDALNDRVTALDQRLDRKTDALDQRIAGVDRKIGDVETRLEQKLDTHFRWLVGIQFAMLVTLVASLVALAG